MGLQMERGKLAALAAASALVLAGAAWVLTQGDSPVDPDTRAVATARGAPAASAVRGVDARRLADSAGSRSDATLHDAAAPYAGYVAALFDDPRYALDPDFIREFKSNTVRFLEAAGRSGESDAYLRLSSIYSDGNLADGDPVLAYAYANAFFQAGSHRYAGKILHQSMDGLSQELRRGNELSRHILDQRQSGPGVNRSADSR